MNSIKKFCLLILLVAGLLLGYFIKCQLDICLIKDFPLDKYPPLSLLQNRNPHHIVESPEINVNLLLNRIPFLSGVGIWNGLWMREDGKVRIEGNGLDPVIISQSSKDWALEQKKMFKVRRGNVFGFSGMIRTSGMANGALGVVLYDANRQVMQWDYAKESISGTLDWKRVEREFLVPDGVEYIRFRLTGSGVGKVSFKGIEFKRVLE